MFDDPGASKRSVLNNIENDNSFTYLFFFQHVAQVLNLKATLSMHSWILKLYNNRTPDYRELKVLCRIWLKQTLWSTVNFIYGVKIVRLFQNCNEILPFPRYLNPCVHIKSLYQFTLLMKVFEGNAMDTCLSPVIPMSYYINKFIMYHKN